MAAGAEGDGVGGGGNRAGEGRRAALGSNSWSTTALESVEEGGPGKVGRKTSMEGESSCDVGW